MIDENHKSLFKWGGPAIIMLVFLGLTIWTWRKWPNLLIDSGRELYIPWQLCKGKLLYKDIAYCQGLFAPHCNSVLFYVFGISIKTLLLSNLSLTAGITALIYLLINCSCDRITALLSSLSFLCCFAFSHYNTHGGFNYIFPYDHNIVYGVLFSLSAIYSICCYVFFRKIIFICCSGFFFGLVIFTKPDIIISSLLSLIAGFILFFIGNKVNHLKYMISLFITFMLLSIIIVISFLLIFFEMPLSLILHGLTAYSSAIFNTKVTNLYFYKGLMGIDHPFLNISVMILSSIAILIFIVFMVSSILLLIGHYNSKIIMFISLSSLMITLLLNGMIIYFIPHLIKYFSIQIEDIYIYHIYFKSLPLIVLIMVFLILYLFFSRRDYTIPNNLIVVLMWAIFGFFLLGKIILNVKLGGYGFVHAMPAAISMVILFIWLLPKILSQYNRCGTYFRFCASIALSLFLLSAIYKTNNYIKYKNYPIGRGGDFFLTFSPEYAPGGPAINDLLKYIERVPQQDTVVVLPEGVMINYLARRKTSIPYIVFNYGELTLFGEEAVTQALKDNPPNIIILAYRSHKEDNVGIFGIDMNYGKLIMDWVNVNYSPSFVLMSDPTKYDTFGVKLFTRK